MRKITSKRIAFGALCCTLQFLSTMIAVPTVLLGNVNVGDGVLLLLGFLIGESWLLVALPLAIGLADIVGGYAVYFPCTVLVKFLMIAVAIYIPKLLFKEKSGKQLARITAGVIAEMIMTLGYFGYEALALGYGMGALVNVPMNLIQGAVALIISNLVYVILSKNNLLKNKK